MLHRFLSALAAYALIIGPAMAASVAPPLAVGTTPGTVAAGNDSRITGAVQAAGGSSGGTVLSAISGGQNTSLAVRLGAILSFRDDFGAVCGSDATAALTAANASGVKYIRMPSCALGWGWTYVDPSQGTTWEFDGPVGPEVATGNASSSVSGKLYYQNMVANHSGHNNSVMSLFAQNNGSGAIGANNADDILYLSQTRKSYLTETTASGEADVMYLSDRCGGPVATSASNESSCDIYNTNVVAVHDIGGIQTSEDQVETVQRTSGLVVNQLDHQHNMFNDYAGTSFFDYDNLQNGTMTAAIWTSDQQAATWTSGTTYTFGSLVYDTVAGYTFQATTVGSGTSTVEPTVGNSGVVGADGYAWTTAHQYNYASLLGNVLQNYRQGQENIQINAAGYAVFSGGSTYVNGGQTNMAGTPNGNLIAPVGAITTRSDGGPGYTLYVKESGAGTALGWDQVPTSGSTITQGAQGTTLATARVVTTRTTEITVATSTNYAIALRGGTQDDQIVVNNSSYALTLFPPSSSAAIGNNASGAGVQIPIGDVDRCVYVSAAKYYCIVQAFQ